MEKLDIDNGHHPQVRAQFSENLSPTSAEKLRGRLARAAPPARRPAPRQAPRTSPPARAAFRKPGDRRRNGAETRLRPSGSAMRTARGRLRSDSVEPILARSARSSDKGVPRPDPLATGRIQWPALELESMCRRGRQVRVVAFTRSPTGIRNNRRRRTLHESVEKTQKE
jgi:hypothetical protein